MPQAGRAHESALDRLIELASDRKPHGFDAPHELMGQNAHKPNGFALSEDHLESENNQMFKALLQFKGLLPYVSRLLPLLDLAGGTHTQTTSVTISTELKQNVTELQTTQRDLRLAIQDQTLQMGRFEDQIVRMREAAEKNAFEHSELVEDVKSIQSLVKTIALLFGGMLAVLLFMVGWMLAHHR